MTLAASPTRTAQALLAACAATLCCAAAPGQYLLNGLPEPAQGLEITEKLGDKVPLDLEFVNTRGETVPLASVFRDDRPVVLAMVYYTCPVACPAIKAALMKSLNGLDYTIGREYNVALVSFDPRDTTLAAARSKAEMLDEYRREIDADVRAGLELFTSDPVSAQKLADAIGFTYRLLPSGEFSHPMGIVILTPDGRVSRYFYNFDYPARDLRLSMLEASEGRIARSITDRILLFCFDFDPREGSYTLAAFRIMQTGAALTVVFLALLIGGLKLSEIRRRSRAAGRDRAPRADRAAPVFPALTHPRATGHTR